MVSNSISDRTVKNYFISDVPSFHVTVTVVGMRVYIPRGMAQPSLSASVIAFPMYLWGATVTLLSCRVNVVNQVKKDLVNF
jgi:hypothetical protein